MLTILISDQIPIPSSGTQQECKDIAPKLEVSCYLMLIQCNASLTRELNSNGYQEHVNFSKVAWP